MAYEQYEERIAAGDSDAMCSCALLYLKEGGKVDLAKAIELYEQAIALNNSVAMCHRGRMHLYGQGGEVDPAKAIELYERAIALNNSVAMVNRAWMHEHGQGGEVDYPKAIALYEQAIVLKNSGVAPTYHRACLKHFKKNKNIELLFIAIDKMELYLNKAYSKDSQGKNKIKELWGLHTALSEKLKNFLLTSIRLQPTKESFERFKNEFIELANSKNKLMQAHRQQWKPIIANILIALTGIGLFAIIIKAGLTKAVCKKPMSFNQVFFFAKTTSERLIAGVVKNSDIEVEDVVSIHINR